MVKGAIRLGMTIKVTGTDRARAKRTGAVRVGSRVLEIVLLAIAGFSLVLLLTQDLSLVTRSLYSPLAIILVVVVIVEYLIIKGGDRSRLYLIELERMHEREQVHVARMRRALEELERAIEHCPKPARRGKDSKSSGAAESELEASLRRIDKILRPELEG